MLIHYIAEYRHCGCCGICHCPDKLSFGLGDDGAARVV